MKLLLLALFSIITFAPVELEKRSLLKNKIELLLPANFKVMTKDMLGKKYPVIYINTEKPAVLWTDDSASVYFAVNTEKNSPFSLLESEAMILEKNSFKKGFQEAYPGSYLVDDGVKVINSKSVGYVKFITDTRGQKMYNFFFIAFLHKRETVICSFSFPEKLLPEWEETAQQIVNSLKVN